MGSRTDDRRPINTPSLGCRMFAVNTGLPTKDEISKTTVRNLNSRFPETIIFFCQIMKIVIFETIIKAEGLN